MQDAELLREYVASGSDTAFAELVDRYVDFVYSTARRQLDTEQLAEEVAQVVFSLLARKAVGLVHLPSLAGWLYRATCFTAAKTLRTERRRRHHEREAANMNQGNATDDEIWEHLSPMLDDALKQLEEPDRLAVFVRFFQKKPMREVGETLGVSEAAAKMRVSRAVERLREFFSKRGVTVGASGLAAVLCANAVQAAPVGLAAAISTATGLAGTTLAATTATATVSNTIAMTTLQKTLIVATLVAAGTGIYEGRQASNLRTQVEQLRQAQDPLARQIQQLARERDAATNRLAALQLENEQSRRDATELARLRGEVGRLRADARELAQLKAADTGASKDPTETEMKSWLSRVNQLKQHLEQRPGQKIPELQFVTEQDWLDAARGGLNTEVDYRKAMSALRGIGERKFLSTLLQPALKQYLEANNRELPADLSQLQPYLKSPVDDTLLQRWEIAPALTVKSLLMGGDVIITQRAPVDDVFDTRFGLGPNGWGSTDFLSSLTRDTMTAVNQAFAAANNGGHPSDLSQLLPYATTPEQNAALQKLMLKNAGDK